MARYPMVIICFCQKSQESAGAREQLLSKYSFSKAKFTDLVMVPTGAVLLPIPKSLSFALAYLFQC